MTTTTTPKYMSLKGESFRRPVGATTAYKPFFNSLNASITLSVTTQEQLSNGNTPGTIAEEEVSRSVKLDLTVQSRDVENLKGQLLANSLEVAAGTDVAVSLPVGGVGDVAYLGVANVTSATFGTLVDGTDYILNPRTGSVKYLTARTSAQAGTVDHDAFTKLGIASSDVPNVELLIISEKTGHSYLLYNVKLNPTGNFEIIKDGAGFASAQLTGSLLVKLDAPTDVNLGQYGRLLAAD